MFGAFAEQEWAHNCNVVDPNAFLISFINEENNPFKALIQPTIHDVAFGKYNDYSLYCSFTNGPSFGFNGFKGFIDISIASESNTNQSSMSNFGAVFKHRDYPCGSTKAKNILAGSHNFKTIEIEVFKKND